LSVRGNARTAPDPIGLSWLVTARWTVFLAAAGALVAGRSGLGTSLPPVAAAIVLATLALSNAWLTWRIRAGHATAAMAIAGPLVCADVLALTWVLFRSGGVLNPASVFYLVEIVLAALVLGRVWTWGVTGLSIAGYGALYVTPASDLRAAQVMHPEIAVHMSGMWLAFVATAFVIALLVTRLVVAVERRDRALEELADRNARAARFAGLTTLAAGAAHELSTPLATMAVAARELERGLEGRPEEAVFQRDARLIRSEIDRCRHILDDLAARSGEAAGEAANPTSIAAVLSAVEANLGADERRRLQTTAPPDLAVVWPVHAVARALVNLVRNAMQASPDGEPVIVRAEAAPEGRVQVVVADRGSGMSADHLARAGEPFFTTKAPGSGTGLGLFVTRSTIEQLGGTLTLVSAPREGTTVTVVLPRDVLTDGRPLHV
jgi:two-component system sensor histidine kinase RegB